MARISGFSDLERELGDIADSFDDLKEDPTGRTSRTISVKDAIAEGIRKGMENAVVPTAKNNAPVGSREDHHHRNDEEGERARPGHLRESIEHEPDGWVGGTYRHRFGSTSPYEYAKVQEFGTRKKNYVITPNGDYPLRFEIGGEEIQVQYVVHPGVEGEHFMRDALRSNTHQIQGYVGNEIKQAIQRAFR